MATEPDTTELTVQLVVGADPIRGVARLPGCERREFWGWLEFAEIVQTATDAGCSSWGTGDGHGGKRG